MFLFHAPSELHQAPALAAARKDVDKAEALVAKSRAQIDNLAG